MSATSSRFPAARVAGHRPAALSALIASVLAASCATQPMGDDKGKPIFRSFKQCMAVNGVGAVLLGVITRSVTGSNATGVAAAAVTLFAAWKACGQTHQRVTVSDERGRDVVLGDPRHRGAAASVLSLDGLEVLAPKAGDDITTRYRFAYTSPDASRKDIAAKERFVYLAGFVNDKGAQQFKEIEFERDFVIQQGQRRHEHAVPSDESFGQFKPWKLRYQLEVEGRCVETEATFAMDSPVAGTAGPAKPCLPKPMAGTSAPNTDGVAASAVPAGGKAAGPTVAPVAQQPTAVPVATLARALRLQLQPDGAVTGKSLAQGTKLRILETRQVAAGSKQVNWVRVESPDGIAGWTREANIKR